MYERKPALGKEEVVFVNMGEGPSLLKNFASSAGNSLLLRAVTSKRDAIGARVTVTASEHKQVDEVQSGGSFISQNDFRLPFGLGKAKAAAISIRWQDGKIENYAGVAANQVITIEEGKGIISKRPYAQEKN